MVINASGGAKAAFTLPDNISIRHEPPCASDFIQLRANCGWGDLDSTAKRALAASIISASIFNGEELIEFGRVVGDGVLYFYIQDVIIKDQYQGRGIGTLLMEGLLSKIMKRAPHGAVVGLMAAAGKEEFYRQFGFQSRPSGKFGAGMTFDIKS